MAKKKKFRRVLSRTGKYTKSFTTGYRSSIKSKISNITNNALRARVNQVKVQQRKTRMLAQDVNKRLRNLQKWGRYDTWASKNLITRLDTNKLNLLDSEGLVDINKVQYLNMTQLANANKAMQQFVNSKTKTIQGINAVVKKKRQNLIEKSDNPEWVNTLSNKEIENLYRVFDDEEFNNVSEHIKYEELWNKVIEANEKNINEDDFISELQLYLSEDKMNDEDVLDSLRTIYGRYVKTKEGE